MAGQSVGIIDKIQSVNDIIQDMINRGIQEADRILDLLEVCD